MITELEAVTPQKVLKLAQALSVDDLSWLLVQLHRLTDEQPLPEKATIDEAIQLYQDDQCSLGKAAELAGVTRWQLQEELSKRDTPATLGSDLTLEEIDEMVDLIAADYGHRQ